MTNAKIKVGDVITGTVGDGQLLYPRDLEHVSVRMCDGDIWIGTMSMMISDRTGAANCIVSTKEGVREGVVYFFFDSVTLVNDDDHAEP